MHVLIRNRLFAGAFGALVALCFCLLPCAALADEGDLAAGVSSDFAATQDDGDTASEQSSDVKYSPMYRLYNPVSGEHFYTANKAERNNVVSHGWHYEGIGWLAPSKGDKVFRLYNPYVGDHHYTTSTAERDRLTKAGWRSEGIGWLSCDSSDSDRKPLLRQYNPYARTGTHNFTLSQDENNKLKAAGWRVEGTAWYGHTVPKNYPDDMKPWYPHISGDYWLDTWLDLILLDHKTLRSCFDYVTSFAYRGGSRLWSGGRYLEDATSIAWAKEMITYQSGNCYRFACLFGWLARGLGYKANMMSGYVPSASGGSAPHGWVEVYADNQTYICDPDLNHELPGYNWFMVTYAGAPTSYGFW